MPAPFTVRVDRRSRTVIVTPVGELDLGTEPVLAGVVQGLEGAYDALVLDLSELAFVDSTGLNFMIREHLRSSLDGFRLVLVQGPAEVQRVFALAGVDGFLPFAPDLSSALSG